MSEARQRKTLDARAQQEFCAIVARGCSRTTAARYLGVSLRTVRNTLEADPRFREELGRAETLNEIRNLNHIQQAGQREQYWRAAAWVLERLYPDRYAAREPRSFTAEQLGELLTQFAEAILREVPDQKLRRRIRKRLAGLARKGAKGGQD